MSVQFTVNYFPSNKTDGNYMGGGYISSGGLKSNFSVMKKKDGSGWFIALPSRKKEDNTYVNEVEFVNKDAYNAAIEAVSAAMTKAASGEAAPRPTTTNAAPATNGPATVKRNQASVPGKPPF